MQKRGKELIYSPSDLIRFLDSPYASWMERFHLEFPDKIQPDEDTEEQKLVARTGDQHEAAYLERLETSGRKVFTVPHVNPSESAKITREAIETCQEIIY